MSKIKKGYYNVDLALQYGLPCAILLDRIETMCKLSKRPDGFCWMTDGQISKETGLTRNRIITARKLLREMGLITVKRHYIPGSNSNCNYYKINEAGDAAGIGTDKPSDVAGNDGCKENAENDVYQITEYDRVPGGNDRFKSTENGSPVYTGDTIGDNNMNEEEEKYSAQRNTDFCDEVVRLYNDLCQSLRPVYRLTEERKKAILSLADEYPDIQYFRKAFLHARDNSFLTGYNKKGWRASFDWLMDPKHFLNCLENVYSGSEPKPSYDLDEIIRYSLENAG